MAKIAQISKTKAEYTPQGGVERCALCRNFLHPGACQRVFGSISPQGWCRLFSAKDRPAARSRAQPGLP